MFWPYYGAKHLLSRRYPPPRHPVLIEPFAGSAGYACRHRHLKVRLYDTDEAVVGTWQYLIRASGAELRSLPAEVEDLADHPRLTQEQQWLIGWWLYRGAASPRRRMSSLKHRQLPGGPFWGQRVRDRLAAEVETIRHWTAELRSVEAIPDQVATWFVDPPYSGPAGREYRRQIDDYPWLADWCRSRPGQVIVCEQLEAVWLPFRPLGSTGRFSREGLWTAG